MRAVALQRGPGEPCAGGMLLVPAKKLTERPAIGAAGVLAPEPVEHQVHERRRRGRDRGQRYGRVAHRQMAAGSCSWRGRAGVLLGPQFSQQVGDPAVDRAEPMETGVTPAAEGDQGGGAVGRRAVRWWTTSGAGAWQTRQR